MKKTIENIWKEGFVEEDTLVVPKVNQLYARKSQHTIEKLLRMGRINLIAIMGGAILLLIGSFFIHAPLAGTVIFLLLLWLVLYGRQRGRAIMSIDKGSSSYDYLQGFQTWVKDTMSGYTRIYRLFYPAFFMTFFFGMWSSDWGDIMFGKLNAQFPDMPWLFGMPVYFLAGVILIALLSSIFAGTFYRKDIETIYGDVMKKLDELLHEMELLRGDKSSS